MRDPDDRVSLAGIDPEEALRALLKVDPDSEPVETDRVTVSDEPPNGGERPNEND